MRVVDALAEITADLHALPVPDCPFDRTLEVTAADARDAVAAGGVDLDDERRGWSATRLLDALIAQLPPMQAREAVTHEDWCLPNVILDPDHIRGVGLIDAGRVGRADRYTDLALMSRSLGSDRLNPQYGRQHVQRYLSRCDHDPADDDDDDDDDDELALYRSSTSSPDHDLRKGRYADSEPRTSPGRSRNGAGPIAVR